MYQQVRLSDHSLIGAPGGLPACLLGLSDAALADLSWVDPALGFGGTGFWLVAISTPSYDATAQVPDGTYTYTADVADKRVGGVANLRALTTAELAANLAAAQQAKIAAISAACAAQITSGFQSSALGASNTYPSQATDQANMAASVLASLMPNNPTGWTTPFLCADANGNWSFVAHTTAQIQQAGEDGKTAILAARVKNATLAAQVNAATTVAAVQAITW